MKYKAQNTILILCIFISFILNAQQPYYNHLNRTNGLPSDEVYNILQDKKGFIWLTTDNGLFRYDGVEYKNYTIQSMSSKAGSYLQEDTKGRIWYCNFDGMIFYVENDTLKQFKTSELQSSSTEFVVINETVIIKQRGNFVYLYNIINQKLIQKIEVSHEFFQVFKAGQLINTTDNICSKLYDEKWHEIHSIYGNKKGVIISRLLKYKDIYIFFENQNNALCIKEENSQGHKVIYTENAFEFSINSSQIIDKYLFICHKSGMIKINLETYGIEKFNINNQSISHIIKDKNGYFWATSNGNGIYIFPPKNNQFSYKNNSLNFKLKEIDNVLFTFNNNGNIAVFDPNKNTYENIYSLESQNTIYDIVKLDLGKLKYKPNNSLKSFIYKNETYYVLTGGNKEIAQINSGVIAMASTGAACIKSDGAPSDWQELIEQNKTESPNGGFTNDFTCSIINDVRVKSVCYFKPLESVYFATNSGVYYANKKDKFELKFENNKIYASKIACFGNCLYFLLNNGEILTLKNTSSTLEKSKILNENGPYTYFKIQANQLFLCNNSKAYYINLSENNYVFTPLAFEKNTSEINDITFYQNQYFFSTYNEITKLIAPTYATNNAIAFYINSITANNSKKYNNQDIEFKDFENDITIYFSVLDYYVKNAKVEYRINSDNWKLIEGNNRNLALASLKPGQYHITFKVNGIEQKEVVKFVILKPWYAQWWFISLVILCLALSIFLIYKWRLNENKTQNALVIEKINLERDLRQSMLSSIKSQMNPHFLFNALNTIQSFIITEDKKNASIYLSKFSKLTRSILTMSEHETIALSEELNALLLYLELEKMRFNDINYSLEIAKNVHTESLMIPSMIIQPFVENSIKHGLLHKIGEKNIFINISKTEKELIIVIEDNGIGRKKSMEINKNKQDRHQSFASEANLKRIEILNQEKNKIGLYYQDILNEDQHSLGTKLSITIPLLQKP